MGRKMTRAEYQTALKDSWGFVRSESDRLGITAVAMADGAKLPRSTVRSYFNGGRKSPRVEPLNKMVKFVLLFKGEYDAK